MQPEYISSHLELPFDGFGRSFRVRFMEREYSVSHPDFFIRCLDGEEGIAVLCRIFTPKFFFCGILRRGTGCRPRETCCPTGIFPGGSILPPILRTMYSAAGPVLWKSAGGIPGDHGRAEGDPREYGDVSYEFEFMEGLRLCFVLWAGDEEFPPPPRFSFPTTSSGLCRGGRGLYRGCGAGLYEIGCQVILKGAKKAEGAADGKYAFIGGPYRNVRPADIL